MFNLGSYVKKMTRKNSLNNMCTSPMESNKISSNDRISYQYYFKGWAERANPRAAWPFLFLLKSNVPSTKESYYKSGSTEWVFHGYDVSATTGTKDLMQSSVTHPYIRYSEFPIKSQEKQENHVLAEKKK